MERRAKNGQQLIKFLISSGPTTNIEVHISAAAGVHDRQVKPNSFCPLNRDPETSMFFTSIPKKKTSKRITIHPINWQEWIEDLVRQPHSKYAIMQKRAFRLQAPSWQVIMQKFRLT